MIVLFLLVFGCSERASGPDAAIALDAVSDATCAGDGCRECDPSVAVACDGDRRRACTSEGRFGDVLETCGFESCADGACVEPCEAARARGDAVGCEYFAVDLENAVEVLGPASRDECTRYGEPAAVVQTHGLCESPWSWYPPRRLCTSDADCGLSGACVERSVCVLDAQHAEFGVSIANPDPERGATVTISTHDGATHTVELGPGELRTVSPVTAGLPDMSLAGERGHAYRIVSDRPVLATQQNPVSDEGVASNGGSLLLAVHAHDTRYVVSTAPSYALLGFEAFFPDGYLSPDEIQRILDTAGLGPVFSGYATLVGTAPGTTRIEIVPSSDLAGGSRPAGEAFEVELAQFETFTIEADARFNPLLPRPVEAGDLTGTTLEGDRPFAVLVGHEAALVHEDPRIPACCADHVEEQLPPASTWGERFAVPYSGGRGGVADLLRIVALREGTEVRVDPMPRGQSCATLGPAVHCDLYVSTDVAIEASEPVLVARFLASAGPRLDLENPVLSSGIFRDSGDPSLSFVAPLEQRRERYAFHVPDAFAWNYLLVAAPADSDVLLDGAPIAERLRSQVGGFAAGRVPVESGTHRIECPGGCSVDVTGWSEAVSYLFPAGLRLERIVLF